MRTVQSSWSSRLRSWELCEETHHSGDAGSIEVGMQEALKKAGPRRLKVPGIDRYRSNFVGFKLIAMY